MIDSFQGSYRWLSNFWPAVVDYEGISYPSVEHAYQAAKTSIVSERIAIGKATAGQAKRLGRKVTMRPDWEEVKLSIMKELLWKKFSHPELRELLLSTGNEELVEGNNWGDTFWGVCRGKGKNHLGRLLMEVRSELKEK